MPYQPALSAEDIINKTRSELIRSHGQALGQPWLVWRDAE